MKHRRPEQVNTSVPAESAMPEFTLEDILQEFGSGQPAEAPQAAEPQEAPEAPAQQEEPVTTAAVPEPAPDPEPISPQEPPKHSPVQPMPAAPEPPKKPPVRRVQASVRPPRPEAAPSKPEKRKPRRSVQIAPEAAPPTPQELREKYRAHTGRLRLALALFFTLANLLLLLRNEFAQALLPALTEKASAYLSAGLLFATLLSSFDVVRQGIRDLLRPRLTPYFLGTLAAVLCIADTFADKHSFCAAAGILLCYLLHTLEQKRGAMLRSLDTVCNLEKPMGVCRISGFAGSDGCLRCDTGDPAAFAAVLEEPDAAQTLFCIYSTILFPACLVAAGILTHSGKAGFLHALTLLLLGAVPCAGLLSFSLPFSTLSKRLAEIQGALCGWYGAGVFSGRQTILLRDGDLFPSGSITSNGMKLYASQPAAKIIGYALAALETTGSPLTEVFEELLQAQFGKHFKAASQRVYDGGIGVEIAEDVVLVGTLPFMQSMGVHMPRGTKVRLAVYVSVNGELAGIFALKYKPNRSTRLGLRAILAKPGFRVILATRDFLITPALIAVKYEVPTQRLLFPDYAQRLRYAEAETGNAVYQGALVAKGTFGAFASAVSAGQTLRSATLVLTVLNLFAGLFGAILCTLLLLWGADGALLPFHLVLFQNLWGILTAFLSFILLLF